MAQLDISLSSELSSQFFLVQIYSLVKIRPQTADSVPNIVYLFSSSNI